jgi:hypothetical protein
MISISRITKEIIDQSPFLHEALAGGLLNSSALAREIQPKIESRLLKPASIGSIVMALQRFSEHSQKNSTAQAFSQLEACDISIRSRLTLLVFASAPSLISAHQRMLTAIADERAAFFSVCYGAAETTFIMSQHIEEQFRTFTAEERLLVDRQNVSTITIHFLQNTVDTPGAYYRIFKELAWAGISFLEIVSSGSELITVFESAVVDRAFSVIKQLQKD